MKEKEKEKFDFLEYEVSKFYKKYESLLEKTSDMKEVRNAFRFYRMLMEAFDCGVEKLEVTRDAEGHMKAKAITDPGEFLAD